MLVGVTVGVEVIVGVGVGDGDNKEHGSTFYARHSAT